jgi:RNA polymerase sigma factor (sigma-70 family)
MQNDDRLKAAAPIASEKLHRDGKLAAERLVGGTDQLTASELMNELQASGGTNSKVLSELIVRHGHIVVNELYRAHVQRHDVDIIANLVWDRVWAISMKPPSEKGAWDPDRSRYTNDPFIPLIKQIANSQAIDYHRHRTVERKRRSAFEDMVRIHGAAWRDQHDSRSRRADQRTRNRTRKQVQNDAVPGMTRRMAAAARKSLPEFIAGLPEQERVVLEQHAQGLKNCEIAPVVGCSKGEVSRRLTKARGKVVARAIEAAR